MQPETKGTIIKVLLVVIAICGVIICIASIMRPDNLSDDEKKKMSETALREHSEDQQDCALVVGYTTIIAVICGGVTYGLYRSLKKDMGKT